MRIVEVADSIHPRNIGDRVSRPSLYFDFSATQVGVRTEFDTSDCHLIVGGGGLLPQEEENIAKLDVPGHKVAWGVGSCLEPIDNNSCVWDFDMCGLRDYEEEMKDYWVPCASCMSEHFDEEYEIKYEMVFYDHWMQPVGIARELPFPRMTNTQVNMKDVIAFLGSGATVVTNSYHGAYWATLLGRKVVVTPRGYKFHTMKHKPTFSFPTWDLLQQVLPKARTYPGALSECRVVNRNFFTAVQELLA